MASSQHADEGTFARMSSLTKDDLGAIFDFPTTFVLLVTILGFVIPALIIWPPVPIRISEALNQTHTKLGATPPNKGKRGAQSQKRSKDDKTPRIKELVTYPIKSCQGIPLTKSKVLPTGLEYDRLFTFAQLRSPFPVGADTPQEEKDGHTWEFATQRQFPLLATLAVDLWIPDASKIPRKVKLDERIPDESWIIIRFPHAPPGFAGFMAWVAAKLGKGLGGVPEKEVLLPVGFPSKGEIEANGYEFEEVTIWKEKVKALNMGRELPVELARYLGVSNKLGIFRLEEGALRDVFRCAPAEEVAGYQPVVGFQDAYPLHLLNVESVKDVEKKLSKDEKLGGLDPGRFRANMIVSEAPAYDEESWKSFRLNQGTASIDSDCTYHVSSRAARCKMPNVDQETGTRHGSQPEAFLRKNRNVDEGCPEWGCLGMMVTPMFADVSSRESMVTFLEVGMELDVLERGEHLYVKQ